MAETMTELQKTGATYSRISITRRISHKRIASSSSTINNFKEVKQYMK